MKICLDVTPVTTQPSGVGFYLLSLINELVRQQQAYEIDLFLTYQPRFTSWLRGAWEFPQQLQSYAHRQVLPIPVRLSNWLLRDPTGLISAGVTHYLNSPDIVHGTNYSVYPTKVGHRIMTIYDVSFGLFPEYATSVSKAYFNQIQRCLKWTDLIITISESSKRDIVNCFNIPESRVWVTPLASRYPISVNTSETAKMSKQRLEEFSRNRISIDFNQPSLLFVGTLEPRKNINTLIESFNYLKLVYKIDHQLLLVGRKGWLYEPILNTMGNSPYKNCIYHLDYVPEQLMRDLYRYASVFVYPSHYEGFGLPVLEAMSLGCPVVSSNTSSIPEVAGNAAMLVSPNDSEALAHTIYKLIDNPSLQDKYVQAGYQQANLFSWEKTAKSTLSAYHSLMS